MNSSNEKKSERITVLARDFTPAAMEFHRKNMSARGYRMEGTIVPRKFQMIEGVEDAKDLFDGEQLYAVTFVKEEYITLISFFSYYQLFLYLPVIH